MSQDDKNVITSEVIGGKQIKRKWVWEDDHHHEETVDAETLNVDNYLSIHLLDGSTINMAVDGTVPVIYRYTVPLHTEVSLHRGFLVIEDGASAFVPGNFAALGAALANGLEISVTASTGKKTVLELWKTNRQIRDSLFDFDQTFKTNGVYTGRWSFTKDLNEKGIVLKAGDVFDFKIQDNLAAMDYLSFRLKGIIQGTL